MQNFNSKTCIDSHSVKGVEKPIRLQEYGVGIFGALPTKSALKKTIKKGLISVDGRLAKTSDWVKNGQILKLYAEEVQQEPRAFHLKMDILYEDEILAVVDKPGGFPTSGNYFKTIEKALPVNLSPSKDKDALAFPQPVHRLDNPTSGVLLIAKTQFSRSMLSLLFEKQKVRKNYVAIVKGNLNPSSGKFSSSIDGKQSFTNYETLKQFYRKDEIYSLINLIPITGRTHQLRIQLSTHGHPILGDPIYGDTLNASKLLLHAKSINFKHPKTDKSLTIESELPHKFVKFMDA
ncbi:RluA family pseudouridine synthase [Psychroflexus tropicus]|uniref:RluA family pseudouridine synthase n=1 Tax=Psychroflexus tropicus TaxID=197345 RepID=UPI000374F68A|nr:RluA family pseudouridine synthase [Psychroflexus tropicus]